MDKLNLQTTLKQLENFLEDWVIGFIPGVGYSRNRYDDLTLTDLKEKPHVIGSGWTRETINDIEMGQKPIVCEEDGSGIFLRELGIKVNYG